ncbi:COG4315 family predicted lipoprotein [Saccharospirillum salsuginis]|uniref:Lipoprotein with Yx(FWY)xxD motif n=1 Tax=Saccharospirillum salsuginis TaxID=418750 RepID=A0A918N8Z0_9GAMM|nr:hypothetical protein [Saccharospirillum salsuginis]GGX55034.1 hypothetical protein GCM10007392_23250 [Saccharospirillum salsuginis]
MKAMIATAAALTLVACASTATTIPDNVPVETRDTSLGTILTDEDGMTLYLYTRDDKGVSNCYDRCAQNWPPLEASSNAQGAGKFSVIERRDGTHQWAYEGDPLYLWVNDQEPGDVTGQGVGDVWFVIEADSSGGMSY